MRMIDNHIKQAQLRAAYIRAALAHPTKLQMLGYLMIEGEARGQDIYDVIEPMKEDRTSKSGHLKTLEQWRLITSHPNGRLPRYSMSQEVRAALSVIFDEVDGLLAMQEEQTPETIHIH